MAQSVDEECLLDSILASLEDIGYTGALVEEGKMKAAIEEGLASAAFVELVVTVCSELKKRNQMQETVNKPAGLADAESFQLEMRGFLQELCCPNTELTTSLTSNSARLQLVDYLLSELMTARLIDLQKSQQDPEPMETDHQEPSYSVPANLTAILKAYGLSTPPAHVTPHQFFGKLISKTKEVVAIAPEGSIGPGLVTQPLTMEQWASLDKVNEALTKEYSVRRQMLLTRCDVTVQSFRWSERAKGKEEEMTGILKSLREPLSPTAYVSIARVLAAKSDLLSVRRTNTGRERAVAKCDINKVLIGKVPDRGGRPQETRPPPEMPSFKQRTEPPQDQRGGGGRGGGRGGRGRVQGGERKYCVSYTV
ncbi:Protein FAM98A [Geodia barretti]|uniref:Protein FAM98A n=1 Tax=Geodia barretti TaxID=519541 RepID=A0AA35WVS1_GEOBA|nr:Protein FAM98A [Geodia barretti]